MVDFDPEFSEFLTFVSLLEGGLVGPFHPGTIDGALWNDLTGNLMGFVDQWMRTEEIFLLRISALCFHEMV